MFSFKGISEVVEVEIKSPKTAYFKVEKALDIDSNKCLSDIFIQPLLGTKVLYKHYNQGELIITIEKGNIKISDNSKSIKKEKLQLSISPSYKECIWTGALRLPISGNIKLGDLVRNQVSYYDPPLVLKSGHLTIYGRTLNKIFFTNLLKSKPFGANSLYLYQTVEIPGGAQLANALDEKRQPAPWIGYADVFIRKDIKERGLHVFASVNANAIAIFAPTPRVGQFDEKCLSISDEKYRNLPNTLFPDCFSVDKAAQLFSDPNLRRIYVILTFDTLSQNLR